MSDQTSQTLVYCQNRLQDMPPYNINNINFKKLFFLSAIRIYRVLMYLHVTAKYEENSYIHYYIFLNIIIYFVLHLKWSHPQSMEAIASLCQNQASGT